MVGNYSIGKYLVGIIVDKNKKNGGRGLNILLYSFWFEPGGSSERSVDSCDWIL